MGNARDTVGCLVALVSWGGGEEGSGFACRYDMQYF